MIFSFILSFCLTVEAYETVPEILPYRGAPQGSGPDLSPFRDSLFYTLAPDVKVIGPVVPSDPDDRKGREQYVTTAFRRLVKQADRIIRDSEDGKGYTPESNENYTYYAFLILALTVPHHESSLTHAREKTGLYCDQATNELSRAPVNTRRVLAPMYRDAKAPLFPDCRFIKDDDAVTQMVSSGNYDDIGLMQINPRYHSEAAEPSIYLNMFNSIDYGLSFIYDGFSRIRANFERYSCEFVANPFGEAGTKGTIYYNLIRAAWGGKYNAGNLSNQAVCRFTKSNGYDNGFRRSLLQIVKFNNSLYHQYLPKNSIERNAFLEIVNNYRAIFTTAKETEQQKYLNQILEMPDEDHQNWQEPRRAKLATTHILKKGRITVRSRPTNLTGENCGYLKSDGATQVSVTKNEYAGYSEVVIPNYTQFAHIYKPIFYVRLKASHSVGKIRSEPVIGSNEIGELKRNRRTRHSDEYLLKSSGNGADKSWYQIDLGENKIGYVHNSVSELVEEEGDVPQECQRSTLFVQNEDLKMIPLDYTRGKKYIAKVIGEDRAFVRERANTTAAQVDIVEPDDHIVIVGNNKKSGVDEWFEVALPDGEKTGWIWSQRVELLHEVRE